MSRFFAASDCGSWLDAALRLCLLPAVDELSAQGCATVGQLGNLFWAQLITGEAQDHVQLFCWNGPPHDVARAFAGHRRDPDLRAERLQPLLQWVRTGAARTDNAKEDGEHTATHLEPPMRPRYTPAYGSRGDPSPA